MRFKGHYEEGNTSPKGAYLWVSIVYNLSIAVALFSLVLFYAATKDLLSPHRPVLKFFVVKAVIFFAFWQSMVLSFGEKLGYVGGTHYCDISAAEIALCWQNFLICNEMLLAAIGMYYAFTYKIYMNSTGDGGEGGEVAKTGSVAVSVTIREDTVCLPACPLLLGTALGRDGAAPSDRSLSLSLCRCLSAALCRSLPRSSRIHAMHLASALLT